MIYCVTLCLLLEKPLKEAFIFLLRFIVSIFAFCDSISSNLYFRQDLMLLRHTDCRYVYILHDPNGETRIFRILKPLESKIEI